MDVGKDDSTNVVVEVVGFVVCAFDKEDTVSTYALVAKEVEEPLDCINPIVLIVSKDENVDV